MLYIILSALGYLIWIIVVLIVVRSVLSWFPAASGSAFGTLLTTFTEPVLAPIRRIFMKFEFARSSPCDFSPWVAVLLLLFIRSILSMVATLFLL